ncbi:MULTISPECIES: RadC family protein [unclassified Clostridium]|uniref:RadC family protein n=1 Tax=unclassified Clostridium TaxID=2614128 RepID=UPI0025C546F1|nr:MULTISPECIES: DNA repair protein RadC [unclassified Clostridium]
MNNFKLTDLPKNERPRERLFRYGAYALSNAELLAIILRTGSQKEDVLSLCNRIISDCNGLNGLLSCDTQDFLSLCGIGEAKAAQLIALSEISKRFKTFKSGDEYRITSAKSAAEYVMEDMRYLKKEYLKLIMLNSKNVVISVKHISVGSLNSSIVHPREVFLEAIKNSSASIIICHNHPSGDPTPSKEDISITNRLKECGKILGIEVLDHIIIGNGIYVSLKERAFL